jgi:hypothetical protein
MEGRERAWARWLDQAIAMVRCSTRMHRQSLFSLYLLTESKKTWSWSDLRLKPRIFIEWNHKWLLCTIGPAINKKKPLQLTSPQSTLLLIISSLPTWHVNDKICVFSPALPRCNWALQFSYGPWQSLAGLSNSAGKHGDGPGNFWRRWIFNPKIFAACLDNELSVLGSCKMERQLLDRTIDT